MGGYGRSAPGTRECRCRVPGAGRMCLNFPFKRHGATGQQPQSGGDPPLLLPRDSYGLNAQDCVPVVQTSFSMMLAQSTSNAAGHPVLLPGELDLGPDRPLLTCGQGEGHPCPCLLA